MEGCSAPRRVREGEAGASDREMKWCRTVTDGGSVGCRSGGENEIFRTRL